VLAEDCPADTDEEPVVEVVADELPEPGWLEVEVDEVVEVFAWPPDVDDAGGLAGGCGC
jgi:hypothetical protein